MKLATIGLTAVLIATPALVFWSAWESYRVGVLAEHAGRESVICDDARYLLITESTYEYSYWKEPTKEVREKHAEAAASMVSKLINLRALSNKDGASFVDRMLLKHAAYLAATDRLFAAIDTSETTKARYIDDNEVDPRLAEIDGEIAVHANLLRVESIRQSDHLAYVQRVVLVSTPIIFALGLVLAIFFGRMLYRSQRRIFEATAAANLASERRFRALVRHATDAILICDASGTVTYQAVTAESGWGFVDQELCDTSFRTLVHPDDQPAFDEIWDQIRAVPGITKAVELRCRDHRNEWRNGEITFTNLLCEPGLEAMVANLHDTTKQKATEQQLTTQAFYDSLTGLPNRALLLDRIEQSISRASRRVGSIGLLFIDLDNFKRINDSLGHQWGDTLLAATAKRLKGCVRPADTVARLGGDEFVILLDQLTSDASSEASLLAQRIINLLAQPFSLAGKDYFISASIGIALASATDEMREGDALLRDADVAMYRAKSGGKGRYVVFDTAMRTEAILRLELETDLRDAIAGNQLRVYFQPIVNLLSGEFKEVEALVRWQHPSLGLIPPADFIPIAEETGLIIPLGQWVLSEACHQVAVWQKQFPSEASFQVSVNLSPLQFEHPQLADDVERALCTSGLRAGSLKLEVTEGAIMKDPEASVCTLQALKALGVRLAIDDFGTGYSSLSYLRMLPLDVLKIDRSFVKGIGKNAEDNAIVRAIISMSDSLGLTVTAEGVETEHQAELLREWSCNKGQGYLFGRPVNAQQLTGLLTKVEAATLSAQSRSCGDVLADGEGRLR
ncbi:putative bifunctional diguanylate cyclase/phosphodiesterase [Paraburkholderia guartelaensis]|uniref:putative bifunctional diguanylate cyclase/phosphodiesterase n=1 Tax=Paraburkholderia guartelaensis TaxID=2546446 RepID=UPI002AB661E6|nr:EAL domain-containing protein [Paraburkholderia guartelaensis]